MPNRREFQTLGTAGALAASLAPRAAFTDGPLDSAPGPAADHTLRIASGLVELAPEHIASTTLYNGQFPGPLLRLQEGKETIVDVHNDTDTPELLHWHGQKVPSDVDGASEEGSPFIPARGMRRLRFIPGPAGFRFYHTHVFAGGDLGRGTYTGQAGPVYIEPRANAGAYDREVFLVLKEFLPSFSRGGDMALQALSGAESPELKRLGARADAEAVSRSKGYEVGYELFSINGRMLGHGEPLKVRPGERVLLHALNASASEIRSLALAGHTFEVVALDGNPVPRRAKVPVLWLGTAERICAIVHMDHPGVWVMGDLADEDRARGMGIVVEYAGRTGKPRWIKPAPYRWDYTLFGGTGTPAPPDETLEITVRKRNAAIAGFNQWTLNGEAFSMQSMKPAYPVHAGHRYRLKFRNASDDIHPLHLHRHSFELVRVGGRSTAGVMKDVVMLGGFQEVEFDFIADNPGPTLLHCHQQLHMDFGFMALLNYV